MQRNKNVSLKHFQELEQSERMANDIATPVVKGTHDRGDHESKVYTQLRPLLVLMKLFGLYYKRESDKFGKVRTEKCVYYCVFLCFLMIVNVIRSFSVYRIGDAFNHALVQKVIFTIWSSECTMKSIILLRACYSQKGLPYFFKEWKYVSEDASLDKWGLLVMKKYIVLTFLFLTVNSVAFLLILQYVPILNEIYLEVVWRDALQFASAAVFNAVFGLLAVLNSTSSMFPVSLFVVLSCAVGKQLGDFNNELQLLTDDEEFHGKFEEFRLRHQHLSGLVDMLDRIFSPMLAAVYCANIPMFCLVLYTMISSTDIHISLVLLNFCWLCFILFQLSVVSYTAAWVNCKVTRTTKTTGMSPNFDQIGLLTVELAAIERLEKSLYTYHWRNVVTSLLPLFMNGSSSFLQAHSPLEHIYTIRFSSTSNDIQLQMYMFLNRLTGTQIGFTAMRLFVVDRPTILTIAGMMMTYFVILIQFKLPVIQSDCLCNVTGTVNLQNSSLEITYV